MAAFTINLPPPDSYQKLFFQKHSLLTVIFIIFLKIHINKNSSATKAIRNKLKKGIQTMKKAQIIQAIQLKNDTHSIKDITTLFNSFLEVITEELKNGGTVEIHKFLTIKMKLVTGRSGDMNGIKWQTEDRILPKVTVSKAFKEATENESK